MKLSQIKPSRFAGKDAGATQWSYFFALIPYRALRSAGFQPARLAKLAVRTMEWVQQ